jgi:mRNA-degrading endonuclease RelE of RelBE toxin-antitoxin system
LPNEIVVTNTFKKGYKQLSTEHRLRVDEAIKLFGEVENPKILGIKKRGALSELFAYEIGQHIRILYAVE